MPDGREVPAKDYMFKAQMQEETARDNADHSEPPATVRLNPKLLNPETPPPWHVEVDEETFQSDVEKVLANGHNALGDEVSKIGEGIASIEKQLGTLTETTTVEQNQRQIEEIERTKGVTEAELKVVYDEFGGGMSDLSALAEVAASRKAADKESSERTQTATEERRESVSKVSGGGNAQPNGSPPEEKGRGLTGASRYNGAAIAAKYKAFA